MDTLDNGGPEEAGSESGSSKGIFSKIEHQYDPSFVRKAEPVFKGLLEHIVSGTEVLGLNELDASRKNLQDGKKYIYFHIGRHLSELDWVQAQLALVEQGMPTLLMGGDNLFEGGADILRKLGAFVLLRQSREDMSSRQGLRLVQEYLIHLVNNELQGQNEFRDVLIYPEVRKTIFKGKEVFKSGRSYTQELLDFGPIFHFIHRAQNNTDAEMLVVPHNISRERVVEDQIFSELATLKDLGLDSKLRYQFDFGFIATHHLYQEPSRTSFRFGKPIRVKDYKKQLNPLKKENTLANDARNAVAALSVFYPSHIFAYAMGDAPEMCSIDLKQKVKAASDELYFGSGLCLDTTNTDEIMERGYRIFTQPEHIGKEEFEKRLHRFMAYLAEMGVPVNHPYLKGACSDPYRALYRERDIVSYKRGFFKVDNPGVFAQYRNNVVSVKKVLDKA